MEDTGAQHPRSPSVTRTLQAVGEGDRAAAETLLAQVYDELHRLAHAKLAHGPARRTLQTTALVHEAFLRMVGREPEGYENRKHFFFAAARAMHDILVEDARKKSGPKAGGGRARLDLGSLNLAIDSPPEALLAVHEALKKLEAEDPDKHRIVMLRFFVGMNNDEAAEMMGMPLRTFERQWRFVRARLHQELSGQFEVEP